MEYKIQYGGLEAKENCKTRVGFIGFIAKMKHKGVILTDGEKKENERKPATSELKCSPDRV